MLILIPRWNTKCVALLPCVLLTVDRGVSRAINNMIHRRRCLTNDRRAFTSIQALCKAAKCTGNYLWVVSTRKCIVRGARLETGTYLHFHQPSNTASWPIVPPRYPKLPSFLTKETQLGTRKCQHPQPDTVETGNVLQNAQDSAQN